MLGYLVRALHYDSKMYMQFNINIYRSLTKNTFFFIRDKTGLVGMKSHSVAITLDSLKWKQLTMKHIAKLSNCSYTGISYPKNKEQW